MNPFDNARMAAGYARSRPAVHPHLIERIGRRLGVQPAAALDLRLWDRAVDGAAGHAGAARDWHRAVGVDAAVGAAHRPATGAGLVDRSGDGGWIAQLVESRPRVRRSAASAGARQFVIYDFGQGEGGALERCHGEFTRRYQAPPSVAVTAEGLEREPRGFRMEGHEVFGVGLRMDEPGYLDYAMTETNVAATIDRGLPEAEIRDWCAGH